MDRWSLEERQAFGQRLRSARQAAGKTGDDVAAIFDVGKQAVYSWEKGINVPSIEQVCILATEFGMPLEALAHGSRRTDLALRLADMFDARIPDAIRESAYAALIGQMELVVSAAQLPKLSDDPLPRRPLHKGPETLPS